MTAIVIGEFADEDAIRGVLVSHQGPAGRVQRMAAKHMRDRLAGAARCRH